MKLSFNALKRFVNYEGSARDCADVLGSLGFPDDGVFHFAEALNKVVLGKILEMKAHPQADRLSLLQVNIGAAEPAQIVCGAKNMKEGDFVAVALPGVTIPGADGSGLKLKKSKIRGEVSEGMCCSEAELGLVDQADGIWIFGSANEDQLGKSISEVFPEFDDWLLEVDVTPNRGDALSVKGLARELGAKLNKKLAPQQTSRWKSPSAEVSPFIENYAEAYGFAGCLVRNVSSKPTPLKWRQFLSLMGGRSIQSLVDITNIVLYETGHPIHFFDADKVDAKSIGVRRAKEGEKILLLNDQEIELSTEDLVIADKSGPVSLAGVMGGKETSVSDETKNILIEVASFDPRRIRETSRRHQLHSESSFRFERGVTPFGIDEVVERALGLLQELSGFETASGSKLISKDFQKKSCLWNRERVESKLGKLPLEDDGIFDLLRRLEYEFEPGGVKPKVIFPWYRTDSEELEDVMEDVARLLGYENLEQKPLLAEESVEVFNDLHLQKSNGEKVLGTFLAESFVECIHPSFTDRKLEAIFSQTEAVVLKNPIHADKSLMRTQVFPQLVERAKINMDHGESEIRLVEVGPVFRREGESDYQGSALVENWNFGCVWMPRPIDDKKLWAVKNVDPFFQFKGWINSVFCDELAVEEVALSLPFAHPKRQLFYKSGFFCELHPMILNELGIKTRCFVGEFRLNLKRPAWKFQKPATQPPIDLDASFLVSRSIAMRQLMDSFAKAKVKNLEWIRPYDIYEGDGVDEKKRAVTFAMRYRAPDRTLELEEAKKAQSKLIQCLISDFSEENITPR